MSRFDWASVAYTWAVIATCSPVAVTTVAFVTGTSLIHWRRAVTVSLVACAIGLTYLAGTETA